MSVDQLSLFVGEPTTAWPTRQSATGVIKRVARRLGYDFVACCAHCADMVVLAGDWRPDGWFHRDTGDVFCKTSRRRAAGGVS